MASDPYNPTSDYHPESTVPLPALYRWPPEPLAALRYLVFGMLFPWGYVYIGLAFVSWHYLVVVPEHQDSLRQLFSETHRRYTRWVNHKKEWRGHLWQERFHSFVMNQYHLDCAVRYVELNPVRAHLCSTAQSWPWSSARAHLHQQDNALVSVRPMLDRFPDWQAYLSDTPNERDIDSLRVHTRTGRPSARNSFLNQIESLVGRPLRKQKPGRKPRYK